MTPYRTAGERLAWGGEDTLCYTGPVRRFASFDDCLVATHSRDETLPGKRLQLSASPMLLGRGADNHIVLDDDSVSRQHARIERFERRWHVLDCGSTNGTHHNGQRVVGKAALENGDWLKIGSTIFTFLSGVDIDALYQRELAIIAVTDGLTGLDNKPCFLEALGREIVRCRHRTQDLALVLFETGQLPRITEAHGRLAGDFVLAELARLLAPRLEVDTELACLGGDSFALLLPLRSLSEAEAIAAKMRLRVSEHVFLYLNHHVSVSISTRTTLLQDSDLDAAAFMNRAAEQQIDPEGAPSPHP